MLRKESNEWGKVEKSENRNTIISVSDVREEEVWQKEFKGNGKNKCGFSYERQSSIKNV